ncbi:YtzC family protein [Bacillus sp. 2205SS5-2]|uniref:YtzC family protein n=1 Tax=Bacillus sp. 2205SS5-2 TaxID=3109031 RepID=UPI0030056DBE
MATRESVEACLHQCADAIRCAQEQYTTGAKQAHYHDEEYSHALQGLESASIELERINASANHQQQEQLHRMRLQVQQLQNEMILLNHDH